MATSFLKCECLFRSGLWLKEIWGLWVFEFAHFPSTLNWSKLFDTKALCLTLSLPFAYSLYPAVSLSYLISYLITSNQLSKKYTETNEKKRRKNCWCYKFIFTLTVSLCICLMVKAYQTRTENCQKSFFVLAHCNVGIWVCACVCYFFPLSSIYIGFDKFQIGK